MKIGKNAGFVLLVVVAILGVMAMLGVAFSLQGRSSRLLSTLTLQDSRSYLLARSGLELKKNLILRELMTGVSLAAPVNYDNSLTACSLGVAQNGSDRVEVRAQDLSGAINLNDGMAAGKLDLGTLYDPRAINPWPADPTDPSNTLEDTSALINLRLRRILNAYGDAHRFVAELGWPSTEPPAVTGEPDGPAYGQPFTFTSTAAGNRYDPQPGRDPAGTALHDTDAVAVSSTGLGDRLIAARPDSGWRKVEDVRDIVDDWGRDHLPADYLQQQTFFELAAPDLTTVNWEDDGFHRMVREFGADLDGDGRADFQNDPTWHTMTPRSEPAKNLMAPYDSDPPRLTDLWRPHSVSVINFNSATDLVRAAVLYAPVNVSFVAEGAALDTFKLDKVQIAGGSHHASTSTHSILSARECLGVSGPVFPATRMRENGVIQDTPTQPEGPNVQRNRLMSLRDALMTAQAYRRRCQDDWGLGATWADSFEGFRAALRDISEHAQPLERAAYEAAAVPHASWTTGRMVFDQQYLEQVLPEILGTQRRLPGWLGAPIAQLSPVIGQAPTYGHHEPPMDRQANARRSAEDFVFRHHLPKITLLPTGHYRILSVSTLTEGVHDSVSRIEATFRLFRTSVRRSQADFAAITDPSTDPSIRLGPEPDGVEPSPWVGTVGLKDRETKFPGDHKYGMRLMFDGGLKASSGSNLEPMDPAQDPEIGTGLFRQLELRDSEMEDGSVSIFSDDSSGSNLGAFGGLMFDSRGHGVRAAGSFNDSLYIRPRKQTPGFNNLIGTYCNTGTLSLWVRLPTGYHVPNIKRNVVHMTFWENMEMRRNPSGLPPGPPTGATQYHVMPRATTMSLGFWGRPNAGQPGGNCGTLSNLETRQTTSMTRPNIFGMDFSMFTDAAYLADVGTVPAPRTEAEFVGGQNAWYRNTMGTIYKDGNSLMTSQRPLSEWHVPQSTHPLPGSIIDFALSSGQRQEAQAGINWPSDPYLARPGSWMRLVMKWDFSDHLLYSERNMMTVAHEPWGYGHWNLGGFMDLGQYPIGDRFYHSICNPKMLISFGERADPKPVNWTTPHEGHGVLPASLAEGDLAPWERLNSAIDNIVLSFGALPNSQFDCAQGPRLFSGQALENMHDAVEALSGYDSVRYDVAARPRWVVVPEFEPGSRLICFGAHVDDVPFFPMIAGAEWQNWAIKSPAVELDLERNFQTVKWAGQARAVEANGITYKSNAFNTYAAEILDADTKFVIRYENVDPNGDPMGDVLTDIPWIEDLSFRTLPPGGPIVVFWTES